MEVRILIVVACIAIGKPTFSRVRQPITFTTSGMLLGQRRDILQSSVAQFLGVPYAQPPVGHLRFLPPRELQTEDEIRNATQYGPNCFQPPHLKEVISPLLNTDELAMSEDCLTLNIFVPNLVEDSLLPVMVWLPGEGFDYASASQFDGSYLAAAGRVIVITVNYRVSVFGFLSTLTKYAPGNAGLLDQRMALKWIKKNIGNFGGDPDKVTLFGRLTGSISASLQLTSPLNDKETLFHRVILQSGVGIGDWAFDKEPMNATTKLAEATKCLYPSTENIVSCLQKVPADILLAKSFHVAHPWRPVFDNYLITEEPLKVTEKGKHAPVDTMVGVNNDDGSICLLSLYALNSPFYQKIIDNKLSEEDFIDLINTNIMDFYKRQDLLLTEVIAHEYKFLSNRNDLREKYVEFCGDMYITSNMVKMADNLAVNKKGHVYMYNFAHRPTFSIQPSFIRAGLGDDVLFTLGLVHQLESAPFEELLLANRTIEAFSNFARNGMTTQENSTAHWPEYSATKRHVMTFSTAAVPVTVEASHYDRSASFWHYIVPALQVQHSLQGQQHLGVTLQEATGKEDEVYFLSTFISVTTAEYALLILFCFCIVLLTTTAVFVVSFCRSKHEMYFLRLR